MHGGNKFDFYFTRMTPASFKKLSRLIFFLKFFSSSTATPPTENEDPPPPEEHFLPHPIRDGVLAFFLPCNCTLTIGPTILLPSSIDCPSPPDPVTFRLTPFHFLDPNNTSTSKKMEAAQANTPSPILNPDDAAR